MWRAYNGIGQMGFIHETVNHSRNFVDPITGTHTQNIESYCAQTKLTFKAIKGVHNKQVASYLDDKMWRDLYKCYSFNNIIRHIHNSYSI